MMLTLIVKVLLQIALIVAFGYLTLAYFQRLFCRDIVKYNYHKVRLEKQRIWTRFRLAIKLKNYQLIIGIFALCLLGFINCMYELNVDWELKTKHIVWQLWELLFVFAIYNSHANMKLKIFYDLTGKDPKNSLSKQDSKVVMSKINEELQKILNHKKLQRILLGGLVILILYAGYSSYSHYKVNEEVQKYIVENKNYKAQKDSLITSFNEWKLKEKAEKDSLNKQILTLKQQKQEKVKERQVIQDQPINFNNQKEREEIYNLMLNETK